MNKNNLYSVAEKVFYALIVASFCIPSYIMNELPTLFTILHAIRIFSVFYCIHIYIAKKQKLSKFIVLMILFYGYSIIQSLFGIGNLKTAVTYFITYVPIAIISEYALQKNAKKYIGIIASVGTLWLIINALTWNENGLFVSPYGTEFFLGIRTRSLDVALPVITFSLLYFLLHKKTSILNSGIVLPLLAIISYLYFVVMEHISTGIVSTVVLIALLILGNKLSARKYLMLYWVTLAINFSIVFLRMQDLFRGLIVDTLGESITFSNRTFIWDGVLKNVQGSISSIIFGNGVGNHDSFYLSDMGDAHNQYMQILVNGGAVWLVLFIAIVIALMNRMRKLGKSRVTSILGGMMCILSIAMLTEVCCETAYFVILLTIMANVTYIIPYERKWQYKTKYKLCQYETSD